MSDLPIPTEAWQAAMRTYHREVRRNPSNAWQAAIRAGIEVWPGMSVEKTHIGISGNVFSQDIILPLPKPESP